MSTTRPPLTWLYVPGDRPERFAKAAASGTDVVIVDLEDAVHPTYKRPARDNAVGWLRHEDCSPVPVQVRVNAAGTREGHADLLAVRELDTVSGVRVPKVESVDDIDYVVSMLGEWDGPLIALLESAMGIENAASIAAHPRVGELAIGEADLSAALGLRGEPALTWIRSRVVVAAAAAKLPPVAMSAFVDVCDLETLAASCTRGRELGMLGRAAIHPRQLSTIRYAFAPKPAEVAAAREIVEAAAQATSTGVGALALPDGRFIDAPVLTRAERTLSLARDLGVADGPTSPS